MSKVEIKNVTDEDTINTREPPILLCHEGVTIAGPTRVEIAVRITEALLRATGTYSGLTIAALAVEVTDELIAELKKEN